MIQSLNFTSAPFAIHLGSRQLRRLFFQDVSVFSICLCKKKKNAETIKFLGILKKYVSKKKIYFCLKKKSNVWLNQKIIFVFQTIFRLDFITQIIYCIVRRCFYSLFLLFLFSYISF